MQFLGIYSNDISQCDIYINNDPVKNGHGLIIDEYVLTLHHIITNNNIYINRCKYDILFSIEEYDLIILCEHVYKGNINDFLRKIKSQIVNNDINIINIKDMKQYRDSEFKIYHSEIIMNFIDIENISLKSNIFPQILMGKFNTNYTKELNGYSGSICYIKNKIFGLLISQSDNFIEIFPLELIIDLINNYVYFGKRYLPVSLNNNIIIKNYRNFNKNDVILKINNIDVNDFGTIYYHKYDIYIPIDTYILLNDDNKVIMTIERNGKIKKQINIKYSIEIFNENKISLNIKENNKYSKIKNLYFKELSEEYLIKVYSNKKIPDINYNNIYTNKKILYLDSDPANIVNNSNEVLILNKISGHKIYNLNQIKHYINQKKCVFEFIDTNNNIMKISIEN